jgi:hypothetical protein
MLKKTLVYDTSKGFSALLKQYYSEKLEIHSFYNNKKFRVHNSKDYELCFFIINGIEDFLLLRDIYFEIEHFFIATPKKYFNKKIESLNLEDSIIIDLDHFKKDMLKQIDFNLSHIVLNSPLIKVERNKTQFGYNFI